MGKTEKNSSKPQVIVAIGASAGGFEALKLFCASVSTSSNLAYIIILHLAKERDSMLVELLQNQTKVPVREISDGIKIEANHIYVSPPQMKISIEKGKLYLLDAEEMKSRLHPIDIFFTALAAEKKEYAAGIILSGTGTDGTLGLREIHAQGGLTLAQSLETAQYKGMPESAIQTGFIDYIINPGQIEETLIKFYSHTAVRKPVADKEETLLPKIFSLLKSETGHDFSLYKKNTLLRRIERRMQINHCENEGQYIKLLSREPRERQNLFSELLIGVTSFFREPDVFEKLQQTVLPELISSLAGSDTLRVWAPGCSTGEEVYSLAMIILECKNTLNTAISLQIFGSDINPAAVTRARQGLYPESIESAVSRERLNRFFSKEDTYYRIKRDVRDCIIFSEQNVLSDPPFSNVHILCCRNLLIYLNQEAQKKLLPMFHYAMQKEGIFILGSSETLGQSSALFTPLDTKSRIFKKKDVPFTERENFYFPIAPPEYRNITAAPENRNVPINKNRRETAIKELILTEVTPVSVIVDSQGIITYIHGESGTYLKPAAGFPSQHIVDMAREGLRFELSAGLRSALLGSGPVKREKIKFSVDGKMRSVNIEITPIGNSPVFIDEFLVVFTDQPEETAEAVSGVNTTTREKMLDKRLAVLEKELDDSREHHQNSIENFETSSEEIKSMNEELQSANEELQSTNEELKSSKEELQSLNEELSTVNSELQEKVNELSRSHDDMQNLLNSTQIAAIFLDRDLHISSFTPESTKIFNLIVSDVGRPLHHVSHNLTDIRITDDIEQVVEKLIPIEREVQTRENNWYLMRIFPYKTGENVIDGVVLIFIDISDVKRQYSELVFSKEFNENIFNTVRESLIILNSELGIVKANESFYQEFGCKQHETVGKFIFNLKDGQFNIPELREMLEKIIPDNSSFNNFEIEHKFKDADPTIIILNARKLKYQGPNLERILLSIEYKDSLGGK